MTAAASILFEYSSKERGCLTGAEGSGRISGIAWEILGEDVWEPIECRCAGWGIGELGIELDKRGVDGRDELLLDQVSMSRALFLGGAGRTIESVRSMLTVFTERSAP